LVLLEDLPKGDMFSSSISGALSYFEVPRCHKLLGCTICDNAKPWL